MISSWDRVCEKHARKIKFLFSSCTASDTYNNTDASCGGDRDNVKKNAKSTLTQL
jgi:hypothetical protein